MSCPQCNIEAFQYSLGIMHRDPRLFTGKISPTHGYDVGGYALNIPMGGRHAYGIPWAPTFDATPPGINQEFSNPPNVFEFQLYENCPKNFIIFDQTNNKSRIMFHPALAPKFSCQNVNIHSSHIHDSRVHNGSKSTDKNNKDKEELSFPKEDTKEIDALLSSEEDEEDDVVSTARTPMSLGGALPSSFFSEDCPKSRTMKTTSQYSYSNSGRNSKRKRERMRMMVRALRGIIPGGERMDTPDILNEAVRYLKSLKVEVQKLGIQNFKN